MNENDSELTTICSQLKMQLGGGTNCPPPLDLNLILRANLKRCAKEMQNWKLHRDKLSPCRNVNSYK